MNETIEETQCDLFQMETNALILFEGCLRRLTNVNFIPIHFTLIS